MIQSFHSEFADVVETKCCKRMVPQAKKASRMYIIRHLPDTNGSMFSMFEFVITSG